MTALEMMKMIDDKNYRDEMKKVEAEHQKDVTILDLENKVNALMPRIRDLLAVVEYAKSKRINLDNRYDTNYSRINGSACDGDGLYICVHSCYNGNICISTCGISKKLQDKDSYIKLLNAFLDEYECLESDFYGIIKRICNE